jgi:hypothetical protein
MAATQPTGVEIAIQLAEFGAEMVAAKFRRDHPDATAEEVAQRVNEWWMERPGAPFGDAIGLVRLGFSPT